MKKLVSITIFITALAIFCLSAQAQTNPESVVANLYKAAQTKNVAEMSKVELKKYFDQALANAIWKAANNEDGLNFDILYNAQDTQIKNFRISKATPQTSTVSNWSVNFTNFGKKERVNFKLSFAKGTGWKISEITYKDDSTLTGILSSEN